MKETQQRGCNGSMKELQVWEIHTLFHNNYVIFFLGDVIKDGSMFGIKLLGEYYCKILREETT